MASYFSKREKLPHYLQKRKKKQQRRNRHIICKIKGKRNGCLIAKKKKKGKMAT